jgi:hypothetical protein
VAIGDVNLADTGPHGRQIPFRWIMRWTVILILLASGILVWRDYPSPAPTLPPTSSGSFYYSHDVWIGVDAPNRSAKAEFFPPGPTLIVHPNTDGWSGYFHFEMQSHNDPASGYLELLLPLTAIIGKGNSSFVSVTADSDSTNSEKLIYLYISVPKKTSDFSFDLPLSWTDPDSTQRLGFGKTRHFLYIGNAFTNNKGIYSVTPFSSSLYRAKSGSATEDTPTATVTIETSGSDEVFTDYSQPESLFSTPAELQYTVDPEGTGSQPGYGLFRTVTVTIENTADSFFIQLDSNVFFVAIGFLLSEVVVLGEERRKARRRADSRPN